MTSVTSRRIRVTQSAAAEAVRDRLDAVRHALVRNRASILWLSPVLVLAAIVSFVNLGGLPQRIDDEGTYTAQAWAVLNYGELAHYTYWYDHPPLGWLQLAGYAQLTGAFARYDIAVLAMREAMVVASLVSVVLVWLLARRLELSRPAAAVAAGIFALSPLAVQFHRTVYLDNIATVWLLAAFLLAMTRTWQLAGFAASAATFAIAVLSKETYLLALPFLIWAMVRSARPSTRRYTLSVAGTVLTLIGGSYLLLALVKGELVPRAGQVSLVDGVMFQLASRDGSGSLLDPESLFTRTVSMWWQLDAVVIVAGIAAAVAGLAIRRLRVIAALTVFLVLFMFRPGGYLPVPYVIILIPFAALLIAGAGEAAVKKVRHGGRRGRSLGIAWSAAMLVALVAAVPLWGTQLRGLVLADLDEPMRQAENWVVANVETDTRLIVDDAMWVDLVRAGWQRENVIWYYKIDTDPAVQAQSPNGWRDSDFVITTDSMRTFPQSFPEVQGAIDNSVVVASFGSGPQAVEVRRIMAAGVAEGSVVAAEAAAQRAEAGAELAAHPGIAFGGVTEEELVGGVVDTRVALALGALGATSTLAIDAFPALDGEGEQPRRSVAIGQIDSSPAVVDGELSEAADAFAHMIREATPGITATVSNGALLVTFPFELDARPIR